MKNKILPVLAIFMCLLALVSCTSASTSATTPESSSISTAEEKAVEGSWFSYTESSLYVKLDANYTTGYEWTVAIEGACVELQEEIYTPHDAPEGMVGVGGTWTCTLNAILNGEATVNFTYARPWDKTDIAETHCLKVSVSNGKINNVQEVTI